MAHPLHSEISELPSIDPPRLVMQVILSAGARCSLVRVADQDHGPSGGSSSAVSSEC